MITTAFCGLTDPPLPEGRFPGRRVIVVSLILATLVYGGWYYLSVDESEPAGRAVLEGEGCAFLVPGVLDGWDALEVAAERESLI